MSEDKPGHPTTEPPEEPFFERWARRKQQARQTEARGMPPLPDDPKPGSATEPAEESASEDKVHAPLAALPDLEKLGADSDYSAFLGPHVDAAMQRKALRKLFQSPKFNVCDGLDDYCEDFTQFEKLGELVTADMRYQVEQAAERLKTHLGGAGETRAANGPAPAERDPAADSPQLTVLDPQEPDDSDDKPSAS